jgi:hypothetical protein
MNRTALFITATFLGGLGAFLGSVVGAAFDSLFLGGYVGGALFAPLAAFVARWRKWIEPAQVIPVAIGSILGLLVAATVATNMKMMRSPLGPLSATLITGLGAVIGARFRTR